MTLKEEFYSHTRQNPATGCVEWTGPLTHDGYGKFGSRRAHRVAVRLAGIHIPEGMVVAHTCDNPPCVNVEHLRVATYRENTLDSHRKKRPPMGEAHKRTKYSDATIRALREDGAAGMSIQELVAKYGMAKSQISVVLTGGTRQAAGGPIRPRFFATIRKLTDEQRQEIAASFDTAPVLARKYGVAVATIKGSRGGTYGSEVTREVIDSVEIFTPHARAVGRVA